MFSFFCWSRWGMVHNVLLSELAWRQNSISFLWVSSAQSSSLSTLLMSPKRALSYWIYLISSISVCQNGSLKIGYIPRPLEVSNDNAVWIQCSGYYSMVLTLVISETLTVLKLESFSGISLGGALLAFFQKGLFNGEKVIEWTMWI